MSISDITVNGEYDNCLSSQDRGLLYGDGLFETIAVKHGQLQYWQEHIKRLKLGCEKLFITGFNETLLKSEVTQILGTTQSCIIKIIITRGKGSRGYKPEQHPLTRIIQKFPWPMFPPQYLDPGIKVTLCNFRLAHQPRLAQIKHLNRLEQVLARSEWQDEYQEGLVCDTDNYVIEATSSNVFFQQNGDLITPDLQQCGVTGVLRNKIIDYCEANNIGITVKKISLEEINDIEGMFVCNSVIGIWPVQRFCHRSLPKTAIIKELMLAFNS